MNEKAYRDSFQLIDEGFSIIEVLFDDANVPYDCRFLEVNPTFVRQTGIDQWQSRTMRELAPELEDDWCEIYGRVATTGVAERFEMPAEALGGRYYEILAFPWGERGRNQVAVVFSDISQRLSTERQLRESKERFEILSEANSLLLATDDPESVIQPIGEMALRQLNADVFFNYVLDEGSAHLRLNAWGGVDQRLAKMIEKLELGQAICGCVARDGERIISADVQNNGDPRAELVRRMGVRCYVCHPIRIGDSTVGTLSFGTKSKDRFSDDEIELMRVITTQVSVAVQKARLFEAQRTRRRRIEALHDVVEVGLSSLDVHDSAQRILDHLSAHYDFDLSSIWLASGENLRVAASVGYPPDYVRVVSLSQPFDAVEVFKSGSRMVVRQPDNEAVLEVYKGMGIDLHSYVTLPLKARGKVIGVLGLVWTSEHDLNDHDIAFFDSVADEIAVVLENSRLYEVEHRIAETLQETLVVLPVSVPGAEFARAYESSTYEIGRVGGDFVDLFPVSTAQLGIAIGDVSGKGVDAAVVTSLVRNSVRAYALDGLAPGAVCAKTNNVIHRFTRVESYVTMFFGLLNAESGLLRYVAAGHPPGLVVGRDGRVESLEGKNPLLGGFDDLSFFEAQTVLCPGDRLILYTDGVTEARAAAGGHFFGPDGLRRVLERHTDIPTAELPDVLMSEIMKFSDGVLRDDAAILVVEPTSLRVNPDDGPCTPEQ